MHFFDAFGLVVTADQRGVGRMNDDEVFATERRDEMLRVARGNQGVFGAQQSMPLRAKRIAVHVLGTNSCEGVPGTDIHPFERHRRY